MTSDPRDLRPFVSSAAARRLGPLVSEGGPCWTSIPAVAVSLDIQGFTALTERLSRDGPPGIELLSRTLDAFFGRHVETVHRHGGEVLRFGGDGLLAAWTAEEDSEGALKQALAYLRSAPGLVSPDQDPALTVRCGLGTGDLTLARVGGLRDRWCLVCAGSAVRQALAAEASAEPGGLSTLATVLPPAAPARDRASHADGGPESTCCDGGPGWEQDAHAYVSPWVRARVRASHDVWMGEMRRLSVAFVRLPDLDTSSPASLQRLHDATRGLQRTIEDQGGSLEQILVERKGTLALLTFGLPPGSAEYHAERALYAALRLRAVDRLGPRATAGIGTGRVFCGPVGPRQRRDFTLLGPAVNLAARLLTAAEDTVLCDEETSRQAAGRIRFSETVPLPLKGISEAVRAFEPQGALPAHVQAPRLVGRLEELRSLRGELERLLQGQSSVTVLTGPPGIGKSALLTETIVLARGMGIRVLLARTDPIRQGTPYHAWFSTFADLLLPGLDAGSEHVWRVASQLLSDVQDRDLLRPVLGLGSGAEELPAMAGPLRAARTRELAVSLLRRGTRSIPTMLCFDDAHWADTASIQLLVEFVRRFAPLAVVVSTRPVDRPLLAGIDQVPRTVRHLGPLPPADTTALACSHLGVEQLGAEVSEWLYGTTGGNPLYVLEVLRSLADRGLIRPDDADSGAVISDSTLQAVVPDSVEEVITGRIDALEPEHQQVLKCASVLGPEFDEDLLGRVCAEVGLPGDVPAVLEGLLDSGLVVRLDEPERWRFVHAVTVSVAYEGLLRDQRQPVHRAVAHWIQRSTPSGPGPGSALLAHHWTRAALDDRARVSLEEAARFALDSGAPLESARLAEQALRLTPADERSARARLLLLLGDARFAAGDLAGTENASLEALSTLSLPAPRGTARLAVEGVRHLAAQTLRRLGIRPYWTRSLPSEDARVASHAAHRVMERSYYVRGPLPIAVYALYALNLAERLGDSPQLARTLGTAGAVAVAAGSRWAASSFYRRAVRLAERLDPQVRAHVGWAISMGRFGEGRWQEGYAEGEASLDVAVDSGDLLMMQHNRAALMLADYFTGRLESAQARCADLMETAQLIGNRQHRRWAEYGMAEFILPSAPPEEALVLLEQARRDLPPGTEVPSEIICRGLIAVARARLGRLDEVDEPIEELMVHMRGVTPIVWAMLEGFAAPLSIWLLLARRDLEAGRALSNRQERRLRQGLRIMRRYSRVFPIGRPRAELLQGELAWTLGRRARGRRLAERGLRRAERLGMRLERARGLELLASMEQESEPRRLQLQAALQAYRELGADSLARSVEARLD